MADKYCVHCGKRIDADSSYCTHCGKTVARRRASSKKQKSGLSIPKMLLMFILIFAICVGLVYYLMTRDTGLVKRNGSEPTPTAMPAKTQATEPMVTVKPSEAASPEPTDEPTEAPTAKPTKTPASNKNASYKNSRYGFSLNYPERTFTSSSTPDNGDGIILHGKNISVTASGSNNIFHKDLDECYNDTLNSYPDATYRIKKSNYYVVSGISGNNIYYIKEYVGAESINSMIIEYPSSMKKEFDAIVTTVANSFKPGDLTKTH